jgi:predicted dehydrogenase
MVRFGIVGFGLHAVKRLMPGFSLSKHCQVTALSRRDLLQAKQSAAQYKIPLAFDSVAELCASSEVDAVLVTTPNSLHLPDVLTAIEAGKPVLCEKPMAMNAGECREMVEAARRRKVLLGVAHVFRFNESVNKVRELIAKGAIGRPIFARSEFSFFADPAHPRKWLYDANLAGAGPIFDVGVHCIDTLRYILRDEVTRASTSAITDERSGNVEAAASLTLEFSRGTLGTVLVSYRADYRSPLEIVGETGVIRANDALNVEHPIEIQLVRGGVAVETVTASNNLVYAMQADAFADAVEGKEFPIPGEEGWQNQEILDGALRSVKSGKAESVPRVGSD